MHKVQAYLADNPLRVVRLGRERLRQLLARHDVTFQRTKTWKESNDPEVDPKLARIDRPSRGRLLLGRDEARLRANYHKTCGVRQFHACYSIGDDTIRGVVRLRKGVSNSLAALRSCRAARPDGEQIYVILDNLSVHEAKTIRQWCERTGVELCFTPTCSSWANPIGSHFEPLRSFVLANSDHPNDSVPTRRLYAYLRWRNANARDPEILALERKGRAELRARRQRAGATRAHGPPEPRSSVRRRERSFGGPALR